VIIYKSNNNSNLLIPEEGMNNMREIKFEYWDGVGKKMYPVKTIEFNGYIWYGTFHSSYELSKKNLRQFTGLQDKNGKEIWEGDIVLTQECGNSEYGKRKKYKQHKGVVEYQVKKGKFHRGDELVERDIDARWNVKIADMGDFGAHSWSLLWNCEVIGNIYENQELLTN
jgi:uncharacterized phage protein (TIGR01671 family)